MPRLTISDTNKAFDDELGLLHDALEARHNDMEQLRDTIALINAQIASLTSMRNRLLPEGTTDDDNGA